MKMILLSLLPVGLVQTWASVEKGYWYARSAKFNHPPLIETLRWVRVIVETIFAFGILTMGFFVIGLKTGWSITKQRDVIGKEFPETSKDS
ncbi:MAG TPA: hypothetical protein VLB50_09490 [Ignavibacteriaceae bacterium]|nr:hypothetical protein [Ignavibacteriaceae bacterium]